MGACIIFCAGEFDGLLQEICSEDYVIAADGGLCHLQDLNIVPNAILGDFDSLGYVPQCAQVFPVEKDDTDAMLAVRKGLELGFDQFVLYGALDGPRLDHTIANFQTLQFLADHGATGYLIGNRQMATVVKNSCITFPADATGIVSVFCMGTDATGITIKGLQYTLDNGTLYSGYPLGVSNHFTGQTASIQVKNGSLLVLWEKQGSLPGRCGCD